MTSYSDDDLDEYAEDYDLDDEAIRPMVSAIRTARPASVMARPADRPVTQAQLQMVVGQFNSRISQNSNAIQRVNASMTGVARDLRRQAVSTRAARRDVGQLRDLILILPLLQNTIGQQNPQLSLILPFLLTGGIGSDSGSSGGGLFGGGNNGLLMILLLSNAFAPRPAQAQPVPGPVQPVPGPPLSTGKKK